jgi:hypothetical protein
MQLQKDGSEAWGIRPALQRIVAGQQLASPHYIQRNLQLQLSLGAGGCEIDLKWHNGINSDNGRRLPMPEHFSAFASLGANRAEASGQGLGMQLGRKHVIAK